jgi:hypothetical protein
MHCPLTLLELECAADANPNRGTVLDRAKVFLLTQVFEFLLAL